MISEQGCDDRDYRPYSTALYASPSPDLPVKSCDHFNYVFWQIRKNLLPGPLVSPGSARGTRASVRVSRPRLRGSRRYVTYKVPPRHGGTVDPALDTVLHGTYPVRSVRVHNSYSVLQSAVRVTPLREESDGP